jgi:hypothetical protein
MTIDLLEARVLRIERENRLLRGVMAAGLVGLIGFSAIGASGSAAAVSSEIETAKVAFQEVRSEMTRRMKSGDSTGLLLSSSKRIGPLTEGPREGSDQPQSLSVDDGVNLRGWFDWFDGTDNVSIGLIDPYSDASIFISVSSSDNTATIMMTDFRNRIKFFKRSKAPPF